MSKHGSDDVAFLLVDGFSLMGLETEFKDEVEAVTEEAHGFSEVWARQAFVGLKRATFEQSGFYDSASDSVNGALASQSGLSRILCYGFDGNTIGKSAVCWRGAMQAKYARIASRGALHKANASYQVNGVVEEGVILHAHGARTANGDTKSTPVNNGAATTAGASLYLQVSALDLDGLASAVIAVHDSADGTNWTLLDTFTAVTAIGAEQRVKTGTIKQYLAVSYTFTGLAAETPSITFMVAAVRL